MAEEGPIEPFSLADHLESICDLAGKCLLPKLDNVAEEITDWKNAVPVNFNEDFEANLEKIIAALKSPKLEGYRLEYEFTSREKALLIPAMLLVGEHRHPDKPWTSKEWVKKCDIILKEILIFFGGMCKLPDLTPEDTPFMEIFRKDLLNVGSPRKSIFFLCLQNIRQKLKSGLWKYYPAVVASFAWIVTQVKYPELSEFVGDVLAPSLLLLDDYNDDNKILGIAVAGHGIANFNKADIVKDNWGLVLYNAFHGLLHDKNPNVIGGVVPLLISVLNIIEVNPNDNCHIFTKYDETMRKILFALDTCSERPLLCIWITQITSYLEILGHATLHWNNKICDSLIHFTTSNDGPLWKAILKCLQVQIKNTWVKPNSIKIADIVLRLLLNCSVLDLPNFPPEERNEIIELCRETIKLLEYCSDFDTVKKEIEVMKQSQTFHKDFRQTLQSL